ncbi:hypothetical protein [Mesorhizobium erdmanii]|uniref:hypothetical protein n=1 Tax=Mesorhizobium erdmanii TaxID=1777866 RepID=UPI0004144691|nr:hypothetical protein [Mesorhizobium erdmanii]
MTLVSSDPRFARPPEPGSKSTDGQLKLINLAQSSTAYVQSQNEAPSRWFVQGIVQRNTKNLPG